MCRGRAPQIRRWRGRLPVGLLSAPFLSTFHYGTTATNTKLTGVYNPGFKAMETRHSHSSEDGLDVGFGLFTSHIYDFCPGSCFLNLSCHSDLPQLWWNFFNLIPIDDHVKYLHNIFIVKLTKLHLPFYIKLDTSPCILGSQNSLF